MNTDRTRTYPENPLGGADFVVGDVHGCFRTLKHAMDAVDFDPERDRLFAVGDLVNRGPHSNEAIDWLERPGRILCSATGNHDALTLKRLLYRWHTGADTTRSWLDSVPVKETMRWMGALRRMPSAITVETPHGPVGVVHAAPARQPGSTRSERSSPATRKRRRSPCSDQILPIRDRKPFRTCDSSSTATGRTRTRAEGATAGTSTPGPGSCP